MALDSPKPEHATTEEEEDLFRAAAAGESRIFSSLSQQQLQLSRSLRNEDGRSLLHVAASSGHTEVVNILAAADPSISGVNNTDEEGWAPLHSSASCGHVEIVQILLSRGASVNLANNGGRTALHYAASKGWLKIAEILISHGAKINQKDKVGCTPLHRAASIGNSEMCELLIEEGVEIDATDRTGQTPLMNAVICENRQWTSGGAKAPWKVAGVVGEILDLAKSLLVSFSHIGRSANTEADHLAKEVALLLIRHGADVDAEDKEGYTVLGRASFDLRPSLIDAAKAMNED